CLWCATPVDHSALLAAQLVINLGVAIAGLLVVIVVGNLAFQIPIPQHIPRFVAAFLLGVSSLFALGLLVAAVPPTSGVANAMIWPIFIAVMFLGGVYLPRWLL